MKIIFPILLSFFFLPGDCQTQKIFGTRNGKIVFQSPSDDDVKAVNNEVASRLSDNGQITFSLLMKGFRFKYAEMQDHFNDEYVESTRFPRADFKGTIQNLKEVNFSRNGSYQVIVKGDLTLHGVTKTLTATGKIDVSSGKLSAGCKLILLMKDFAIDASRVTEKVILDISCQYQ